jgi:hypothetical protein
MELGPGVRKRCRIVSPPRVQRGASRSSCRPDNNRVPARARTPASRFPIAPIGVPQPQSRSTQKRDFDLYVSSFVMLLPAETPSRGSIRGLRNRARHPYTGPDHANPGVRAVDHRPARECCRASRSQRVPQFDSVIHGVHVRFLASTERVLCPRKTFRLLYLTT